MMKKLFIKCSMLLLVLGMSINTAWGINISGMTDEQAETYGFWARLTAKPATTTNGSGKVFVIDEDHYESDPEAGDYATTHSADGFSDIYVQTSLIDGDVHFRTYSLADPGSYFIGWSFTNGNTDMGTDANITPQVTPSSTKAHANIREYIIYAAFEKVKLTSYEFVSGSNTTTKVGDDWTCTQTIKFRAETPGVWALSSDADVRHFKRPVVTKKEGTTGTWSIGDAEWITSGVGQNFSAGGEYAELSVPVVFTAPNGNPGEYAAELVLETYAGVKMKVYLYARTTGASGEAIRYNSSKVQQEAGLLATLLNNAEAGDIIKLNGNYSNEVDLNKNITFDLNGHTLSNTVTVSDNNVTIAYSPYGGTANELNVTGGKAILNGGTFGSLTIGESGTVEQNGAVITGAATNNGTLITTDGKFQGGLESNKTLVVNGGTFTGATAIDIKAGSADIKKGTITGTTYGIQSKGTTTIGKLAVISGGTIALNRISGTLTVNGGRFTDPNNLATGEIVFNAAYFQTNSTEAATVRGKQVWRNTAGTEARAGYAFFAGDQAAAQANNVSVCRIGQTSYSSLEDALAYANNNPSQGVVIIMENDYVLPAGYYTLPANATLIVPMSNDQQSANPLVPRQSGSIVAPVSFRKLTFANGVNMTVAGTLELTCTQYGSGETMGVPGGNFGHLIMKPGSHMTINNGGELRAWGFVSGDGTKDAEDNYLSGEIDARRGATVREMFQMGDWKGGDISFTIAMEIPGSEVVWRDLTHLFPVYTYFIQNVESPVKYHPGSSLICATSVNVASTVNAFANDIKVVGKYGESAMFLMDEMADAENTWVRKWYDAKNDKQVYEVNSGAQLGSLVIELGEVPAALFGGTGTLNLEMDSRKFVLPLTNNFKIHLLSGSMQFTQSTSCLPGMEVEIDKESEISIVRNVDPTVQSGALYLYDADQWSFQNNQQKGYVGNSGKFGAIVRYSPTWDLGTNGATKKPNARSVASPAAIGDAVLNVHGTFRMGENCAVYTTWSKNMETLGLDDSESASGGAKIISSNEDAGTFIFDADAPAAFQGLIMYEGQIVGFNPDVIVNYEHNNLGLDEMGYPVMVHTALGGDERVFGFDLCTSAKLTNGDGTFAETQGMSAGTSYCYIDGRWTTMGVAEESECFMKDNYGTFYAKPAEYIAVVATVDGSGNVVGNDDHTYSDAAGAGRLFILTADEMGNCDEWWEVEKKDNLYHCIHPNNDTYYYWDDTEGRWMEQRFTITWKNYDGTEIKSYTIDAASGDTSFVAYSVTYGTQAEYLGELPTRPANIDYTYNFTGWSPALGKVTSDVTYTATYEAQPRKYTIIFENEGGDEIERQFLLHNDVPVCENTPTRTGFTLEWEPAIAAVTGDATYRATWLENPPTEYAVTFYDYDGTTVLKPTGEEPYMVAVGAMPTPPAQVNGKPATSEYTYVFDHWSPALEKVSVTSVKSYTAVYREEARTYTISYYKEDGTTLNTTEELPYGGTPTPPAVTKENPATGHTYTLVWKTLDETGTIQTVMGDASYKPTYIDVLNKYTVTVKSNPSGACSITGAGLYDYNTSANITLSVNDGYTFTSWSDGYDDEDPATTTPPTTRTITVTEDINLVANFTVAEPDWTIRWKNENGSADLVTPVGQKNNTATIYPGATPTKEAGAQYTYTFYGWSTSANGGGTIYKNGLTPKATADATYYAYFTSAVRQYNVALTSNIANVCTLVGAGTYDYSSEWANATVIVSGYDATNYTFDGWYNTADDLVSALESYSFAVQSDVSLVAKFSPVTYTVTWMSENGLSVLETDEEQAYGAATAFNGSEPTKDGYSFIGWTTAANGAGSFYAKGATPAVSGDATYYAYFAENAKSLEIGAEGVETLTEEKDYASFIITSNGTTSGQLINANNLSVLGNAIFRLEQSFAAGQWYAVAVPWTVEPATGIYGASGRLALGSQIYVIEFDANAYAGGSTNTFDYWKFLHETGADMVPGKLYMIYLTSGQSQLNFYKKAGAAILTTETSVAITGGDGKRDNWNAIANPALYHANLATGATKVQKYNGNDSYIVGSTSAMIVGEPMFVQVTSASIVDAAPVGGASSAPYRRAPKTEDNTKFVVELTQNGQLADRLIVETADEKANKYVIGQDLAKFGVSSKVAQMWVNRYDAKLCANTVEMTDERADYPLSIFAPVAGEYTITIQNSKFKIQNDNDYSLYLTLNGEAIWNLSDAPYTLTLEKGTSAQYGLRISIRKAPEVATGMDEAVVDAQGDIRKVLINDQVFIIRGEKVYTIDGQLVK